MISTVVVFPAVILAFCEMALLGYLGEVLAPDVAAIFPVLNVEMPCWEETYYSLQLRTHKVQIQIHMFIFRMEKEISEDCIGYI